VTRKQKQFEYLDALEAEFRRRLIEALRVCASGRDSLLFLASEMWPGRWPRSIRSAITDDLLQAADGIVDLRRRHKLATEGCLALRFRETCRLHADTDDHNRLGSRRLAEQLLAEIQGSG